MTEVNRHIEPPPNYHLIEGIDGFVFHDAQGRRHAAAMQNLGHGWSKDTALARAWRHYEAHRDE